MSKSAEVRLVRCPKCQNLLPELNEYSVYQCGGCGALLRAKNKKGEQNRISVQSSDEERLVMENCSRNFDSPEDKGMVTSEIDAKSNASSSSAIGDRRDFSHDSIENHQNGLRNNAEKWVFVDDFDVNNTTDERNNPKMPREFEDSKTYNDDANKSRRTRRTGDWMRGETMEGSRRPLRMDVEDVRYSSSKAVEEDLSNYPSGSNYGNRETLRSRYDPRACSQVEYLEQDRAELLKKLDELQCQLRDVDISKEKIPQRRMVHQDAYGSDFGNWFPDESLGLNSSPLRYSVPANCVPGGPSYENQHGEPSSYMNGREMGIHGFHPPAHRASQVQGFGKPFRLQMLRAPPRASGPFQPPSHSQFSRQHVGNNAVHNIGPFETYPTDVIHHHPSCSCFQCLNKYHQASPLVPPPIFYDSMFPDVPNYPAYFHHDNSNAYGPRGYNPDAANPLPLNFRNPQQSKARWTGDLNSEVGGFVHRRPTRVVIANGGPQCRPVAGGAPFFTCQSCFELLQLPKNILLMQKIKKKMRCGSCSTVLVLEVANKGLIVSIHTGFKRAPVDVSHNVNLVGEECQSGMNFSSDGYDNSRYDFQPMDGGEVSSTEHGIASNKSVEMRSTHSTVSCTSDEENPGVVASARKNYFVEPSSRTNVSPPPAGSPLQDHFEYSNKYNVMNPIENGSRSGRSEREVVMPGIASARQNSMKNGSFATEIDISSNEYSNTGTSQESGDASRDAYRLKGNNVADLFLTGIKKSFRDFSRSSETSEQERINVTVNGHSIPDKLVKKAEKLAGTIRPGEYWYDFRAGFWGVMGGPCLGIIPPFIDEFSHSMPEKCAGGNTRVFVNGRELHQKDLNLLSSRGLPAERDRSYIIEISGRVLDEDSGEELQSLGKLAPTVEKVKHGFGMKVPNAAAQG